jgi:hypothetical protein
VLLVAREPANTVATHARVVVRQVGASLAPAEPTPCEMLAPVQLLHLLQHYSAQRLTNEAVHPRVPVRGQ